MKALGRHGANDIRCDTGPDPKIEDAVAGYKWVAEHAKALGGDPTRIAVAGESAGGNLAVDVAIAVRDQKLTNPVHRLLVYRVAGTDLNTPSHMEEADAKPLNKLRHGQGRRRRGRRRS